MSFLTPKEKARLAIIKRSLALDLNPYEHISNTSSGDKPYKINEDTRLTISPGRTYFPKPSTIRRQRPGYILAQQSLTSNTGIVCIVCNKDTTYHTSVKGRLKLVSGLMDVSTF